MPDTILELPPGLHVRSLQRVELRVAGEPADGTAGTFDGYGVLWGVTDTFGTTFERGCFDAGGLDENVYALLWMHNPFLPLGGFRAAEDETGLRITGWWDDTPEGQQARNRARSGSAPELSVGFNGVVFGDTSETQIIAAGLQEVSQVTARWASSPGAALTAARSRADEQRVAEQMAAARARAAARLRLR